MCFTRRGHGSTLGSGVAFAVLMTLLSWSPIPGPAGPPIPQQCVAEGQEKEEAAPKQSPEPAWTVDLRREYGLKADEVLRRVAAPFPPCRDAYLQSFKAYLADTNPDELAAIYCWDGKNLELCSVTFASDKRIGRPLISVLEHLGIPSQDVEADEGLLRQHIDGEFVVRTGAPADKVIPRLEKILREELNSPIRLKLVQAEREVLVVGGKYESKPRENRGVNQVDLFAVSLNEDSGSGGGSGTFDEFLAATGTYIGRRLVNELPNSPSDRIGWHYHNSRRVLSGPDPNRDPDGVLKNVAAQTGLTFKAEKRKARVLFVEKE